MVRELLSVTASTPYFCETRCIREGIDCRNPEGPCSAFPSRRSPSYIICNTTSSDEVLDMKVTVQVDRARIRQDLVFQYVEDPTIVRIEPEWSIVR